jgi:predicted lipid-binding transport protein (Tim44 family)
VLLFGLFLMMILLLGLLGFLVWKQMRHVQSVQNDMVAMTRDVSDWKSNVMAALEKVNQPPPTDDLSTVPEESEHVVSSSASSVADAGPQNMPDLAAMLPGYRRRADVGASNNQSQATAHTMNQSLGEKFSKLFLQQPVVMSR